MSRREHGEKREERRPKGKKGELQRQLELVSSLVEQVRAMDSEIDLIKQKINLIIREIKILKRAVLVEKKEIKELKVEEEKDKSRFESILGILRGSKEGEEGSETP